jgi:hypothetical protein
MSRTHTDQLERLFDDVEPSLLVPPPVVPARQSFLENIYGAPAHLPISGATPSVPTIESTIEQAQTYLDRQHEKGFIARPSLSEITEPYFRRRLLAKQYLERKAEESNSKQDALQGLFKIEPFQEFWFKAKCVIRTCTELGNLLFLNSGDAVRLSVTSRIELRRSFALCDIKGFWMNVNKPIPNCGARCLILL